MYKEGTPNKDGQAAGGSFGIGKNAPYAASELSLLCYSTHYINKHRTEKFIARCKLVAHDDPKNSGEELQHVGFGTSEKYDGRRFPPVMGDKIPDEFRLDNPGTGIFIFGFKSDRSDNWENSTRRSIARNFFAAIHDRKLAVMVGNTNINNETLHMEDFGDGVERQYYDLYEDSSKPILVEGVFGKFYLKIATGDEDMENRVAYINMRGMLITDEKSFTKNPFYSRVNIGNYVAIVWAVDEKTEMSVRKMENPAHELIEYKRLDGDSQRKTREELEEISEKIRRHIKKKLNYEEIEQSTNLIELSDIIPFVSEPDKNNTDNDNSKTTNQIKKTIEVTKTPFKQHSAGLGGIKGDEPATNTGNQTGKTDTKKKKPLHPATSSQMKNIRVVRHGDKLRVAFDSKTGLNKFSICPAGEEVMDEEFISFADVEKPPRNSENVDVKGDLITVNSKIGSRVVLELPISNSLQYTGYSIMEYRTRRKSK